MGEGEGIAWNGTAGAGWVAVQGLIDRMFAPLEAFLAEQVAAGERVLDIGCGTGATTIAAARRAGSGGALGLDISEPMITAARQRAEWEGSAARFALGDAQDFAFTPATFDRVISRFGVMFFEDAVAAFANVRRALVSGGKLHLIVWRSADENRFMTAAERAVAPLLPDLPVRDPDARQGQFAFADPDRVRLILRESGWREAALERADFLCEFPVAALYDYLHRLGPVGRAIEGAAPELRERVTAAAMPGFDRYVRGDMVRFTAACWSVMAIA